MRAPLAASESDTDECMSGSEGLYVRAPPCDYVEEGINQLGNYSIVAPDPQVELINRVKELENIIKELSKERSGPPTGNPSTPVTTRVATETVSESAIRWDNIIPFPKNVPATKMWEAWTCFIEDFEIASSLSNVKNPRRRVELLLLSMGEELKGVVRAAKLRPESESDDCYEIFVRNIDRYLKSMTDPAAEHESFSNMRQEEGESAVNFHARLSRKVQLCGYSLDDQDRFVRTQLLRGLRNQDLKKAARMYGHDSNFIVQSATRAEAFHAETPSSVVESNALIASSSQQRSSQGQFKRRVENYHRFGSPRKRLLTNHTPSNRTTVPMSRRNRCPRCFRPSHRGTECPAKRKNCNLCGVLGHFAAACRDRRVNMMKQEELPSNVNIEDNKEQVIE